MLIEYAHGSPPRMWGRQCLLLLLPLRSLVHPHACGEAFCMRVREVFDHGSPPRMWGRLIVLRPFCSGYRFTPTHVGKTYGLYPLSVSLPVHPHACGEDSIIPSLHDHSTVHPHACGEDRYFVPVASSASGSPPRMWGRRSPVNVDGLMSRFTPTHVGKTLHLNIRQRSRTVHPHACGEDHPSSEDFCLACGSPPRMWGRPRHRQSYRAHPSVHPHACGEDCSTIAALILVDGSPPRMWGRRSRRRR